MKTYEQNPSKRWGFARERGKSGYQMDNEFDRFLKSSDALTQTDALAATLLKPGDRVYGLTAVALL